MRHWLFVLGIPLMWCTPVVLNAQAPAVWLSVGTEQKLPNDWFWSASGQSRTATEAVQWREGIVDVRLGNGLTALPGWSLDGTWRSGVEWPAEGGWVASWRWATSVKWRRDIGDNRIQLRMRHQIGGPWLRPWDRARLRMQVKWSQDLPEGWKVIPSIESFFGPQNSLTSSRNLGLMALRGRVVLDKKVTKRRHVAVGYQFQSGVRTRRQIQEHTMLMTLDLGLKKVKSRKKEGLGS